MLTTSPKCSAHSQVERGESGRPTDRNSLIGDIANGVETVLTGRCPRIDVEVTAVAWIVVTQA